MPESESGSGHGRQLGIRLSRREACKLGLAGAVFSARGDVFGGLAEPADPAGKVRKSMNNKPHIVVVGAGAFGGWTALYLLRGGARVTLLDAWGPGNSRASSGGETRVMRGAYGANQPYTKLAARAMELWTESEARWKQTFFHRTGVLWMVEGDGEFERGSLQALKDAGIPFEQLSAGDLARRWTQINFEKV